MTYSFWERLHFKLFGYWPRGVVERRLAEYDAKVHANRVYSYPPGYQEKVDDARSSS